MRAQITQSVTDRLRKYSSDIVKIDRRPLLDKNFSFPWKECAVSINEAFHLKISLESSELRWREGPDFNAGICSPFKTLNFVFPGICGQVSLLISITDIETAMETLLKVSSEKILAEDPSFLDQFWVFFQMQVVSCAQKIPAIASLGVRLKDSSPVQDGKYLCQDVALSIGGVRSLARLVMSVEFLDSWREQWLISQTNQELVDVDVDVAVEAARIRMTLDEIRDLNVGEVLLLKHPFYVPGSPKARIFLTYQNQPLFRAKLEEGRITILEMPLIHEAFLPQGGRAVEATMDQTMDDEESSVVEGAEASGPTDTEAVVPSVSAKSSAISAGLLHEPFEVDTIPLSVAVQIGTLRFSVKELSALQPGNILDLSVRPEDGVSLVANGAMFAKGTLVLVGDNLGVQITELFKVSK